MAPSVNQNEQHHNQAQIQSQISDTLKKVQKFMPTDIKHLEHIIQYTQPNQNTQYGSKLCQRKQCLDGFHDNQLHQKKALLTARGREDDDLNPDPNNQNNQGIETFEEECENFMRNLHKYYEKFIKNENAFMQKSYLESNMFSNKRRTIENLIKNKQIEKGLIKENGEEIEHETQVQEAVVGDKDSGALRKEIINRLLGYTSGTDGGKDDKKSDTEEENPYTHLFGAYDFRYYNSKMPQPPKDSLGKPSGRKQVQLLNEWFESMMEQYVYKQKQFLEREDQRQKAFYYSKVILTICIRDLVRQVSVHCIERGAFIEKVLNIYLSIYEAELRAHLYDIDQQKGKHILQIKNIRDQNRQQMVGYEKLIDSLNVKLKEFQNKNDRLKNENEQLKDQIQKMMDQQQYSYQHHQARGNQKSSIMNNIGKRVFVINEFQSQKGFLKNKTQSALSSPMLKKAKLALQMQQDTNYLDQEDGNGNLGMRKSLMENLDDQGSIQRKKVINKKANTRIRIADSSDSFMTEDEDSEVEKKSLKKKKSKATPAINYQDQEISDSLIDSSQDSEYKKKKIGRFGSQMLQKKVQIKSPQITAQQIDDQSEYVLSGEGEYSKEQIKVFSSDDEKVELKQKDNELIKDTIKLLEQVKKQDERERKGHIVGQGNPLDQEHHQDEEDNPDEHNNYILQQQADEEELLDESLELIEKEQKVKLISQLSEITKLIYHNPSSDFEPGIEHKELLRLLVEAVMKNNQQTLLKLISRASESDVRLASTLLGSQQADTANSGSKVTLSDMLKQDVSNMQFIKLANRRQSHMNLMKKIVKEPYASNTNKDLKDADIQTEDFNFINYDSLAVETAEIYMFERVSRKLRKMIVEIDPVTQMKVFKQFEYSYKGQKDDYLLQLKSSVTKKMEAEFKYKVEIKNKHYEINRANKTMKSLIQRINDLQSEINLLQVQKGRLESQSTISSLTPDQIENENISFKTGYLQGFEIGRTSAYFKGYQEGQHFGHQNGFQDGVKEGWSFGFDDGFKYGVRRIFRDCREQNINIDSLDLLEYINKEDQLFGLKRYAFDKIFKIISKNERLQQVYKLHEKFLSFNEKKKKRYAKMGRKNVIKMVAQLYQQIIQSWQIQVSPNYLGLLEYMFDDFSKKYGNVKLAEKKILQILGSTYYHIESHPKIAFFGMCLHLGKRGYSNDVLFFYLQTKEKIQSSNVGINVKQSDKSDIDIVPYLKALDGIKMVLEDKIPVEAYGRVKVEVERFTITKDRAKVVDLDKLLELMVNNYLRFGNLLSPQLDQIYHAFTLYENYFMTYNELMMLIEYAEPEKFRYEIEPQKFVEVDKKEFQGIFEKKRLEQGKLIFEIKKIAALFEQTKSVVNLKYKTLQLNIQVCKDKLEEIYLKVRLILEELFRGQKWKNMRYLDSKENWQLRIQRIEKWLTIVNNQIIILAAYLYLDILQMYLNRRKELYGDSKEDDDEIDLLDINGSSGAVVPSYANQYDSNEKDFVKVSTQKKLPSKGAINAFGIINSSSGGHKDKELLDSDSDFDENQVQMPQFKDMPPREFSKTIKENQSFTPANRKMTFTGKQLSASNNHKKVVSKTSSQLKT